MVPDEDGDLRFVSGLVLFPQRWSLMEKIGMDMHRIHVPVPLFEKSIENSVSSPDNLPSSVLFPARCKGLPSCGGYCR